MNIVPNHSSLQNESVEIDFEVVNGSFTDLKSEGKVHNYFQESKFTFYIILDKVPQFLIADNIIHNLIMNLFNKEKLYNF